MQDGNLKTEMSHMMDKPHKANNIILRDKVCVVCGRERAGDYVIFWLCNSMTSQQLGVCYSVCVCV